MRLDLGRRFLSACFLAAIATATPARDLTRDQSGASDLPGVPRFADSVIIGYRLSEFDQSEFPTAKWDDRPGKAFWSQSIKLEGRRTRLLYLAPANASSLEVIENYRRALEKLDYQPIFQCSGFEECGKDVASFYTDEAHGKKFTDSHLLKSVYSGNSVQEPRIHVARRSKPDGDSYVFVFAAFQDNYADSEAGKRVAVFVEEVVARPMQERMVLLDAGELARGIDAEGRVALYGIHFDVDQASLRPESRPQLEQMARMLSEQPELSVFIVGHTDNQGSLEYNMDLSQRRAAEVVRALISNYGILGERLTPMGVAGLAPVASNAGEEGRARNRRVEMVAK
ncbi:flagellar motor protein MotB [Thiocystis minor]|uniref:OmpA family protein n=1 Tax=Thiocystis minor TaxID=61597 RepID=UPI0019133C96|nr:OmpA family protein [Thiocystis minor]MBK5966503.1 flagellar motor protein MotB [Thiocystis minor]